MSITIQTPPPTAPVHSHLALIIGQISPPPPYGSSVTVTAVPHPPVRFPVHPNGRFKALAPLTPGENGVNIECGSTSTIHPVFYQPLQTRPISLIIVAARNSPVCFDDVGPSNFDMAARRLRMAAYLWQAYTAEQMMRAGFGARTFQFETEWGVDTVSQAGVQAQIPKVTLVRSNHSLADIRDENRAQQGSGSGKQDLYGMMREAVENAPEFRERKDLQAAVLIMDATHDRNGLIVGHAALGGSGGPFPLAIFGSHTCFSWPETLDQVVPAFLNRQAVDTRSCGIDAEGKDYGMAAQVGIGAMMHEVGHMLTCPHQSYGVMLRDYTRLADSFIALQADDKNECKWHRLDTLRFISHPSFAFPTDKPLPQTKGPILVTAATDGLQIYTPSSELLAIEYRQPGKETADQFIDLFGKGRNTYSIPRNELNHFDRITVLASDGGKLDDFGLKNIWPSRHGVLRSPPFGSESGSPQAIGVPPNLRHIRVYCGAALDGIELDGALFGKRGGSPKDWPLHPGETVMGINVRHGAWMDGIQFVTTQRTSPWFGSQGGGPGEARVPAGYRLSGVYGHVGQWCQGMGFEFEPIGAEHAPPPPRPMSGQQTSQQGKLQSSLQDQWHASAPVRQGIESKVKSKFKSFFG
ncbi:hypothetical protein CcaverHIS002_0301020 [Cutaneotrichosporon cavernicola]|uniref:Jacalin-type lectin domain-containing protein n=1 Tax=Cutaneotrichosporon cavernicola TaxID=279322 RepID=A0AA48I5J2_9TREE|nr:uncharacterized protein CcaverHIS019_0300990 [Cutaneotrichosporon cavernicola]BEI82234.1 hypothetical protein CcaverHIS002_0301020 [Cutaneotrichosporon cavernicola]BEI90029.1 hypothetical protein CcaverHIS019_0300990 [Cutaneotrichosporon cavernicola]BEI97803.1 hypothetical protein CcaverHIS631_0301020 [Cutaneotrichosporon cavernicola]BEJ05580.1 hypothetical protein CcaverHIS641_0301020 [Cutaneotrichosporon cavernicola]